MDCRETVGEGVPDLEQVREVSPRIIAAGKTVTKSANRIQVRPIW